MRGCGKRKRFHVLYYQTSETGWVPEMKMQDFKQNLEVPRPYAAVFLLLRIVPRTFGRPLDIVSRKTRDPRMSVLVPAVGHVLLRVSLSVAQVLRSQKTKLIEDLKQAIKLATEAEAGGGASAALPPKKRAAAVEGPATGARALGAAHSDKPRGAHPGALNKRRRLAQQAPAGCEIAAAGCWERGDERAEALEWKI